MLAPRPEFSVVVSTYCRPAQLRELVRALERQTLAQHRFEVIVVNDGGPQDEVEEAIRDANPRLNVRVLHQSNLGPGAGRNTGAAAATGDYLAFTDDDCVPEPRWLEALAHSVAQHPGAALGGGLRNGLPNNIYADAAQRISDAVYAFYNADPVNSRFFSSNNLCVPATTFQELGGFDPCFRLAAEDRDFCDRWRHSGESLVYVRDAVVTHCPRLTLTKFVRQYFRYGQGAARFHNLRAARGSGHFWDDAGFHTGWHHWLSQAWRELAPGRAIAATALLLLWQLANLAGFVDGWLRLLSGKTSRARYRASGNSNQKVEPFPNPSDSTPISPE